MCSLLHLLELLSLPEWCSLTHVIVVAGIINCTLNREVMTLFSQTTLQSGFLIDADQSPNRSRTAQDQNCDPRKGIPVLTLPNVF